MLFRYHRHGLIVALALAGGAVSLLVQPRVNASALPPITALLSGTTWQPTAMEQAGPGAGLLWRQWRVRAAHGASAVLYVEATSSVKRMVHWSGELAYEGAGYQLLSPAVRSIRLRDGGTAPISTLIAQRLGASQLVASAVVSPDGISAHSTDTLFTTAWETLRGAAGPYYLVRVSVATSGGVATAASATSTVAPLLSAVLSHLRANARARAT